MKPLNYKERNKAFYKVIGLFVLCFVLAMVLGFSTMNATKVTNYGCQQELEKTKNDLKFQQEVFQPNIQNATEKLKDMSNPEGKILDLNVTKSDIKISLENIMSKWIVNEEDPQYVMYKNIIDSYFALESAYEDKIKLEEQVESNEGDVKDVDNVLQRTKEQRDDFKEERDVYKSNSERLQAEYQQLESQGKQIQIQLKQCQDENKALKFEISKRK